MKFVLFLLSTLFFYKASAQEVGGVWEGNYGWSFGTSRPLKLLVDIHLYNDSMVTGSSHLYYLGNKFEHYKINGKYNAKDSTISFAEDSTIGVNLGFFSTNIPGKYIMKLSASDTALRLKGRWKDNSNHLLKLFSTHVWLEKKLIKTKDSIHVKQRVSDVQSLIEVGTQEMDSIKIEVYDNGDIDKDSVTLFLNDELLIYKQQISLSPITMFVTLKKDQPVSKLKLVAESLGSIPPCTAVLIVTTRLKRYEVNLASTLSRNGVLEFFLKD